MPFSGLSKKKDPSPVNTPHKHYDAGNEPNAFKATWWAWVILIIIVLVMAAAKYWDQIAPLIPGH